MSRRKPEETDFSRRLKERSTAVGLTQAEIARRLKISPGAVGHWFQGRDEPRTWRLQELAALLKCSPHYLRTGEEDPRGLRAGIEGKLAAFREKLLAEGNMTAALDAAIRDPGKLSPSERLLLERSGPGLREYLASASGESWLRLTQDEREMIVELVWQIAQLRPPPEPPSDPS